MNAKPDPPFIGHTLLVRVLFALYADDSGIWERDLFTEFIELRTSTDGSDLGAQLALLQKS